MFHTINEFEAAYTNEIKMTQGVLDALTDESARPGCRRRPSHARPHRLAYCHHYS